MNPYISSCFIYFARIWNIRYQIRSLILCMNAFSSKSCLKIEFHFLIYLITTYAFPSTCVHIALIWWFTIFCNPQAYGGDKHSSGLDQLFDSLVDHLTASHSDFLRHWDRLIDLESKASSVYSFVNVFILPRKCFSFWFICITFILRLGKEKHYILQIQCMIATVFLQLFLTFRRNVQWTTCQKIDDTSIISYTTMFIQKWRTKQWWT